LVGAPGGKIACSAATGENGLFGVQPSILPLGPLSESILGELSYHILLEVNPLDDIRFIRHIAAFVTNGKLYTKPLLKARLAKVEEA
jgi:hypothetical protein